MSSAQAVSIIKKISGAKKCGHMGTLDPFACGVLPIALGRATKLFDYLIDREKKYRAIFKFGIETDTFDLDGYLINTDNKRVTLDQINQILPEFIGIISQLPPKFSAKRINGQRAYELARSGQDVELKPSIVKIYDITVQEIGGNEFVFDISCSGGTYIRSICRDIAYKLDTCATMTCLIRQASGIFNIQDSCSLQELEQDFKIISCQEVLKDYIKCIIENEKNYTLAVNGAYFRAKTFSESSSNLAFYYNDELIGIGQKTKENLYKLDVILK
ncbi:MAG TPA: tRNA pseudouridine(55) synthase TruB [Clostridia bacterium]